MANCKRCVCCKTNVPNDTRLFCENCWYFYENKIGIEDIAVMVASIRNREPKNEEAKQICEYLVANNYMQGKARLPH